jgi:hypothetical protein
MHRPLGAGVRRTSEIELPLLSEEDQQLAKEQDDVSADAAPEPPAPLYRDFYFLGCLFSLLCAMGYSVADIVRGFYDLNDAQFASTPT